MYCMNASVTHLAATQYFQHKANALSIDVIIVEKCVEENLHTFVKSDHSS